MRLLRPVAIAATLVGLITACHTRQPSGGVTVNTGALTDANIIAALTVGNNNDIAFGTLALATSTNADVRNFASMTKRDHEGANAALTALATAQGITPQDAIVSLDLRDQGDELRLKLREFEGAAFDSAYIANEIAYHEGMLRVIDEELVPAVRNPALKDFLPRLRVAVVAHRDHAKSLAAK